METGDEYFWLTRCSRKKTTCYSKSTARKSPGRVLPCSPVQTRNTDLFTLMVQNVVTRLLQAVDISDGHSEDVLKDVLNDAQVMRQFRDILTLSVQTRDPEFFTVTVQNVVTEGGSNYNFMNPPLN